MDTCIKNESNNRKKHGSTITGTKDDCHGSGGGRIDTISSPSTNLPPSVSAIVSSTKSSKLNIQQQQQQRQQQQQSLKHPFLDFEKHYHNLNNQLTTTRTTTISATIAVNHHDDEKKQQQQQQQQEQQQQQQQITRTLAAVVSSPPSLSTSMPSSVTKRHRDSKLESSKRPKLASDDQEEDGGMQTAKTRIIMKINKKNEKKKRNNEKRRQSSQKAATVSKGSVVTGHEYGIGIGKKKTNSAAAVVMKKMRNIKRNKKLQNCDLYSHYDDYRGGGGSSSSGSRDHDNHPIGRMQPMNPAIVKNNRSDTHFQHETQGQYFRNNSSSSSSSSSNNNNNNNSNNDKIGNGDVGTILASDEATTKTTTVVCTKSDTMTISLDPFNTTYGKVSPALVALVLRNANSLDNDDENEGNQVGKKRNRGMKTQSKKKMKKTDTNRIMAATTLLSWKSSVIEVGSSTKMKTTKKAQVSSKDAASNKPIITPIKRCNTDAVGNTTNTTKMKDSSIPASVHKTRQFRVRTPEEVADANQDIISPEMKQLILDCMQKSDDEWARQVAANTARTPRQQKQNSR